MTRDEILEKSRMENRELDERERQINTSAGSHSAIFALFLCLLISVINLYFDGPRAVGAAVTLIILGSFTARELHLARKLESRKHRGLALLFALCTVIELVCLIFFIRGGK